MTKAANVYISIPDPAKQSVSEKHTQPKRGFLLSGSQLYGRGTSTVSPAKRKASTQRFTFCPVSRDMALA